VIEPFKDIEDARALAQAIVDTVREPMLVLDGNLRVLAVSRFYCLTFQVYRQDLITKEQLAHKYRHETGFPQRNAEAER
jgi:hypothetical protein